MGGNVCHKSRAYRSLSSALGNFFSRSCKGVLFLSWALSSSRIASLFQSQLFRQTPNPYTLNSKPYTLNSKPYFLNPKPYTLNSKPYTLNSKPYTLHLP